MLVYYLNHLSLCSVVRCSCTRSKNVISSKAQISYLDSNKRTMPDNSSSETQRILNAP